MAKLTWDEVGNHRFEIGVDQGVLYLPDDNGAFIDGVAWNGLTTVTEKPTGAESNKQYADNIVYLNLYSIEQFEATVEALTYPPEFAQFDGFAEPVPGLMVGQQSRRAFGLSYRTLLGNDVVGYDLGYKLHLVYGCMASPSEKAYATVNDSPEAMPFSWDLTTTPQPITSVPNMRPTALLVLDSTKLDSDTMDDLLLILHGDDGVDPSLPTPDYVLAMFAGTVITVTATQPTFDSGTNTITIPTVAGVTYYIDDEPVAAGPVVISSDTIVQARPNSGHVLTPGTDDDWFYNYTP